MGVLWGGAHSSWPDMSSGHPPPPPQGCGLAALHRAYREAAKALRLMAEADKIIYVGNVCSEVNEATLRAVFENCGYVAQIRIAGKPGFNTVFCFVEFAEASQAQRALGMDGLQLGERKVRVSMAKASSLEKYYEKVGHKDNRPPAAIALQARAQAKLQALQQPVLQSPLHGFQNGHSQPALQPHFDAAQQLQFPQLGNLPQGLSGVSTFAQAAEPSYMQNGSAAYPPTCTPPFSPGGPSLFSQSSTSSFAPKAPSGFPLNGSAAFAPAPGPLQPQQLLNHQPQGALPPPRLAPPPVLKPIGSDFGRGYGSNGVRLKRPHQDPEKVERTIYIENLPDLVNEEDIADLFAISGEVTSVRVVNKGQGQTKAWVEYETPQQALTAREHDQTVFEHPSFKGIKQSRLIAHKKFNSVRSGMA